MLKNNIVMINKINNIVKKPEKIGLLTLGIGFLYMLYLILSQITLKNILNDLWMYSFYFAGIGFGIYLFSLTFKETYDKKYKKPVAILILLLISSSIMYFAVKNVINHLTDIIEKILIYLLNFVMYTTTVYLYLTFMYFIGYLFGKAIEKVF